MPEQLTTEKIQQMMYNIRMAMRNAINRDVSKNIPNGEDVQEIDQSNTIEKIPQEEPTEQNWKNKPRGRGMGWFTNLNLGKEHVTMKDDGGEIN